MKILDIIKSMFSGDQSSKIALQALILSVVICAAIYFIVAIKIAYDSSLGFTTTDLSTMAKVSISSLLVVLFFIIWFILHILNIKELDDAYSIVREKLVGIWAITYDINYDDNTHRSDLFEHINPGLN